MSHTIAALLGNPATQPALTSATIAAAVSLFVLAVSQYLVFKKSRTDFLTPKLEELYLLINELSEHNVTSFKLHYRALTGDAAARNEIAALDELDVYGLRRAKKIVMLVRLYFPKLSRSHQLVFAAERHLNAIQHAVLSPAPPDPEELLAASGKVGHFLMLMEQELIRNRDILLRATVGLRPYRFSSETEIASERPRPPGDPFGQYAG